MPPTRVAICRRHQVFVIARVGKHYRCLATVHHDYTDTTVVSGCMRLIRIFSDAANRRPLELELRLAADFYKDDGPPPQTPTVPDWSPWKSRNLRPVRFPFIATCLVVGAGNRGVTVRPAYIHTIATGLELDDMAFDAADNNEGITVLDITDLRHVRYCFAASKRIGWRWAPIYRFSDLDPAIVEALGPPPPLMKPWSCAESTAEELAPMPMVRASSLAELWPWGAWVADDSSEDASSQVAADEETRQRGAASLWDLALSKLVKAMVSSRHEDFVGLLEAPKQLPNFSRRLRDKLFAVKDDLVASSAAAELLRAAFAGETFLDWSLFFGLAPETITDALQGPELVEARGLSICPDWNTTTPSALAEAICSFPHLRDLYIMESPARLNEGPIGELYLALAANPRCPRGKILLAGASSHAVKLRMWIPTTKTFLPLPSFPIQQLIITPFAWPDLPRSRDVSLYYLQLADAFLTPSRFVGGLLNLLASIAATDDLSLRACAMSAAHIFAFAPALDRPSALEIGALPAETFTMAKMVHHRHIKHRSTKMRDLLPGAWTVLVDTKPDPARRCANGAPPPYPPQRSFQVAFVRPKTKTIRADPTNPTSFRAKELEVLGLEKFLRFAAPEVDIAWLDRRLEQIQEILGDLASEFNRDDQILISRRPMDARAACNLLKHAIECLPTVDREYGDLMAANELTPAQFWYPEVDEQQQQQPAAEA